MSRVSRLGFIRPQLPSLIDQPPESDGWIHEVKHDGFRTILVIDRGTARAFTRNGHDWSDRYPSIVATATGRPCRSAILDGEVIVQDKRGASDFEALQIALRFSPASLIFYAFDLLHLDGADLCKRPLLERRAKLRVLMGDEPTGKLHYSEEFIGDAAAFFKACAKHQLEGIVSKRADAPYRSGRSKTWRKTKCFTEGEFILLGIDRDRRSGAPRALLAQSGESGLMYVGAAFLALSGAERETLVAQLDALAQERPPISWLLDRQARWLRPEITVRVKHLAGARLLRHATVRELCAR